MDPDQLLCQKPSDLVLQCLQRKTNLVKYGKSELRSNNRRSLIVNEIVQCKCFYLTLDERLNIS